MRTQLESAECTCGLRGGLTVSSLHLGATRGSISFMINTFPTWKENEHNLLCVTVAGNSQSTSKEEGGKNAVRNEPFHLDIMKL